MELMDNLIKFHNREERKLSIDAMGDLRVRAGCYIRMWVEEYDINQPFLVEECSHSNIEGTNHIMKLELKVI